MSLHLFFSHSHLPRLLIVWLLLLPLTCAAARYSSDVDGPSVDPGLTRIDTSITVHTAEGHRIVGALFSVSTLNGDPIATAVTSDPYANVQPGKPRPTPGYEVVEAELLRQPESSALCHLVLSGGEIVSAYEEQVLRLGNDTLFENVVPCRLLDKKNLPAGHISSVLALNDLTSSILDIIRLYVSLSTDQLDLAATLDSVGRQLLGADAIDIDGDGKVGFSDFTLLAPGKIPSFDEDDLSREVRSIVQSALARAPLRGPNIVMIVADDLGYGDVASFWPESRIKTPNLDRIAAQGARFTDFHVQPVCASTRASILSGYYHRQLLIPGAGGPAQAGIPRWARTMPETLRRAGYRTAAYGKWHLSRRPGFLPNDRGFQDWLGFYGGSIPYSLDSKRERKAPYLFENGEEFSSATRHATDLFADRALNFISQQSDEIPFFLYLAFNAPHTPIWTTRRPVFSARPDWLERVREDAVLTDATTQDYAALVQHMDQRIGEILDILESRELDRNTLVVFLSDNGADVASVGPEEPPGSNGPFRAGKGSVFEGGTRVPLLMQWPATIRPGTRVDSFTMMIDLWPTIRELAGVHQAHGQGTKPLAGVSLLPLLSGVDWPLGDRRREGWFVFPLTGLALRQPPWKLIRHADGSEELFNIVQDPGEHTSKNSSNPEQLKSMSQRIDQYLADGD